MDYNDLCMGCMEEKGGREVCLLCGYNEPGSEEPSIFLPPRTVLYEKYLIGRVLGQGGFGITYLAWDINLDIKIAVKEFFPQGLVSRGPTSKDVVSFSGDVRKQFEFGLERFLHEARTLARFADHPNIVTVRDFFRANGTAYMVMNYIEGLTLEEYLEQAGGKLSFKETLEIMMPVLDALKEVHLAGILHRDISPDNIFIDASGRVVLIDFGAARQEMQQKSRGLSVIMKAGYAPEEQYRTRGEQGPWTDVYAAAATMYRAITGQVPLESMDRMAEDDLVPPSELGADIEPHQEQAMFKAMALRARDRYRTIEEFQDRLQREEKAEETAADEEVVAVQPAVDSTRLSKKEAEKEEAAGPAEISERPLSEQPAPVKKKKTALIAAAITGAALLLFMGIYFSNGVLDEEEDAEIEEVAEPEYEAPTNYIESIDAEVVDLKFFESGDDGLDWDQRTYDTRFSRREVRYINWELDLKHPAPGERKYFEITFIYYWPFGGVMGGDSLEAYIDPYWDNSQHNWGLGRPYPGHWRTGTYYVELIVDDVVIASGEFEIYQ